MTESILFWFIGIFSPILIPTLHSPILLPFKYSSIKYLRHLCKETRQIPLFNPKLCVPIFLTRIWQKTTFNAFMVLTKLFLLGCNNLERGVEQLGPPVEGFFVHLRRHFSCYQTIPVCKNKSNLTCNNCNEKTKQTASNIFKLTMS